MLSPNAVTVLEKRYLAPNPNNASGKETVDEMFRRVASALAQGDAVYGASAAQIAETTEQFFKLMYSYDIQESAWGCDFLPNSPTLANAGARTGQCSACFVLPVPDDLGGIFESIKNAALIHQTGGGTGFAFSRLRPRYDLVVSTQGISSGPMSFADVFNAATESIKQGGVRRGANMGMLRVDHPDILHFISYKEDLSKLTNFNISVAVTNAFMEAVEKGTDYVLINPRTGVEADLYDEKGNRLPSRLDARTVFKDIVLRAWSTGEPGVIFIDRMNDYCPVPWLGSYEATNPCGEQALIPYESCNLGSINLERMVKRVNGKYVVDWDRLGYTIDGATHLLDNVITINKFPIPELKAMSDATRKIGLGVMGFARLLFLLNIPYGSEQAIELSEKIMSFIDYRSKLKSVNLATTRGSFPARNGHESESNAIFKRMFDERQRELHKHEDCDYDHLYNLVELYGIRNSNTTTVAPTGTLSIVADTSGGCEPVFMLSMKREQADSVMYDTDKVFKDFVRSIGLSEDQLTVLLDAIDRNHGTLDGLAIHELGLPSAAMWGLERSRWFVTAHDITPVEHVRTQAAFQKYIDSSISKTINFSEHATPEDVEEAYMMAWYLNCKGITVYRNNSRKHQPLSSVVPVAEGVQVPVEITVVVPAVDLADRMVRDGFDPKCPPCVEDYKAVNGIE